jgi:hypothetical protein
VADVFDRIPRATVASWPSVLTYPVVRCAMVEIDQWNCVFGMSGVSSIAQIVRRYYVLNLRVGQQLRLGCIS